MREITDRRELQQLELEIFDAIHAFCIERNLRYSLCYGSLLGAIRHKGFIPWDDDIDICMPRPDYEIFCREFKAAGFSVHTHWNDSEYVYPFAKVYHDGTLLIEKQFPRIKAGVYVDVFPIDGFPDNKESLRLAKRSRMANMRLVFCRNARNWVRGRNLFRMVIREVCRCALLMLPTRFFINRFQNDLRRYGFENMPFVADMTWGYGERQCVPASVFESFVSVDFEGRKAKAVVGWELYLRNVFGDYTQLPPLEKRVSNHSFKAWRKD